MVRGRVVKKIFHITSEGRIGRSKWRWSEYVERGLREMEVKRWGQRQCTEKNGCLLLTHSLPAI